MTYTNPRGIPGGNPIANILVIIAGTLAIAASIVVGFFAFVILAAAFVVLAAVIGIRLWWVRRKLERSGQWPPGQSSPNDATIEGEFIVIERKARKDSQSES